MSEEEQEIRVLATLDVLRQDLRALHSMLDDAQRERDAARADADELRARLRTPRGRWILLGRAHEHARRARALRDAARAEVRQERDALLAAGAHVGASKGGDHG